VLLDGVELRTGGGGEASFAELSVLENLVLAENTAGGAAGGVYVTAGQVTLVASTLDANDAGSTASEVLFSCTSGTCSALNSIFWDGSTLPALSLTRATVRHSIVRGGATGTAISSADPLFVARDILTVTDTGVAPVYSDQGAYEYQTAGRAYAAFSTLCP
jgi:hypothetical protein